MLSDNPNRRQSAGFFRWEAPGEPMAVHFHLNTVELLERDAMRAGKTPAAGILLGRKDGGRQSGLIVENYEPVPHAISKSTDSPFGDRRQLKGMIDLWQAKSSRRIEVLGFYRSAAPGETILNEDDLSVLNANSGEQEAIFLLIEPGTGKASNAFLFLMKQGVAAWQWNLTPFSRGELSRKGGTARPSEIAPRPEPRAEARPPRRQMETGSREKEPAKHVFPQEGSSLPLSKKWQWAIGAGVVALLLVLGLYQLLGHRNLHSSLTPVESTVDSDLGMKVERTGTDWRLSWNPNAPAILNASSGQLIITDGSLRKVIDLDASDLEGGTIVYSPLSNDISFRLQVRSEDSAQAMSQTVRIVAGVPYSSLAPLLSGINSSSNDPTVTGQAGPTISAEEVSEIERRAGISPSAAKPIRSTLSSGQSSRYGISSQTNVNSDPRQPLVRLPDERLLVSKPTAMPVIPRATRERVPNGSSVAAKPITPPAVAEVPAVNAMKAQAERIPVLPAIGAAVSTSVSSSAAIPRASRRGGTVQPAQLLSNINPVYPSSARQDGVAGPVELHFKIGTNGDVHDVMIVRGPSILAQAAADAVRNRKYKPARVDGVPTETDASATFDFKLN